MTAGIIRLRTFVDSDPKDLSPVAVLAAALPLTPLTVGGLTAPLSDHLADLAASVGFEPRPATVTVRPNSAVVADGSGYRPADPTNLAHRGKIVGITLAGAMAGDIVTGRVTGEYVGVTGDFAAGQSLYLALDGTLTRTLPATATWTQTLGTGTASGIVINFGVARLIYAGLNLFPPSPGAAIAALIAIFDRLPVLPASGTDYPASGGLFRNGDANGYTLTRIYPTDGSSNPLEPILPPTNPSDPAAQAALAALLASFEGGLPQSDAGLPVGAWWSNGGIPTRVKVAS